MLCNDCKQLREVNSDNIVCNIQQARITNVEKCSFYQKKECDLE